jgi:hypothetical protein
VGMFDSLASPFQAAWDRRVSIAYRGAARLCDSDHNQQTKPHDSPSAWTRRSITAERSG